MNAHSIKSQVETNGKINCEQMAVRLQDDAVTRLAQNLDKYDENRTRTAVTFLALTVLAGIATAAAELYVLPVIVVIGGALLTVSLTVLTVYKVWCSRKTTIVDIYKLILQAKFSEAALVLASYKKQHGLSAGLVANKECPLRGSKSVDVDYLLDRLVYMAVLEGVLTSKKEVQSLPLPQKERDDLIEDLNMVAQHKLSIQPTYRTIKDPAFVRILEYVEDAKFAAKHLFPGKTPMALPADYFQEFRNVTADRVGAKTYDWLRRVSQCKTTLDLAKLVSSAPSEAKLKKLAFG